MELLTITLAANETRQFAKAGRYFEIIESIYAMNVAFYGANGAQSDQMIGALSGLYLEDPYSHFAITNGAGAQTVTVLLMETGRGGSRRQPGNVIVIDAVGSSVQTVAVQKTAIGAFSATEMINPAANINGTIIRGIALEVQAGAGGTADCAVVCAPTVPILSTGTNMLSLGRLVDTVAVRQLINSWDMSKKIPAGWGMWLCTVNATAVAAANAARTSFELL